MVPFKSMERGIIGEAVAQANTGGCEHGPQAERLKSGRQILRVKLADESALNILFVSLRRCKKRRV